MAKPSKPVRSSVKLWVSWKVPARNTFFIVLPELFCLWIERKHRSSQMFIWKPGEIGGARAASADGKAGGGDRLVGAAMPDRGLDAHDFQFLRRDPLAAPLGQIEWWQFCAGEQDG